MYLWIQRKVARKLISLFLATTTMLVLAGCVTSGAQNRLEHTKTPRNIGQNGVAMLHFDRSTALLRRAFELEIKEVDPKGGEILSRLVGGEHRGALATMRPISEENAYRVREAFELTPGNYAITRISEVSNGIEPEDEGNRELREYLNEDSSPYYGTLDEQLVRELARLALTVAVVGGNKMAKIMKGSDDDKLQLPNIKRGEIILASGDKTGPRTPVFSVKPGRVTYIGRVKLLIDRRPGLKPVDEEADSSTQTISKRTVTDERIHIKCYNDLEDATESLSEIGLGALPIDLVDLCPILDTMPNLWDFKYTAK